MTLPITYEVMVDWDMTDWADTPDFGQAIDDISDDVKGISVLRGKDNEEGNSPASTFEIQIKGYLFAKYSPANTSGPLYQKLYPWRITRIRSYHNATWYNLFLGFISKISVNPDWEEPEVYIYVTDGLDLLARQVIGQDHNQLTRMSDGDAIDRLLDVAGWSASRRSLDVSGGDELFNYPECYSAPINIAQGYEAP